MRGTDALLIDRKSWLGHRWQRHGLGHECDKEQLNDLLLLGMQGSRQSGGEHALSQRTTRIGPTPLVDAIRPDGPLVTMWSVRGAPHAHRARQLDILRDALAPLVSDDGGQEFVDAVAEVAEALTQAVTGPTPKGDASGDIAGSVSKSLVRQCKTCGFPHVPDGLFRAAGRQAQLVIGAPKQGATMLYPPPRVAQDTLAQPRLALLQAYFRINGPTTRTLFRDWMEGSTQGVAELWGNLGDDLVRVKVDTKRQDLPESLVEALQNAPPAEGVALVPPNDPWLRQADRTLLVPDADRRRAVYRPLSGPGALLVDGEVAGTWRYRRSERQVTVEAFDPITTSQRATAKESATALAASTGDDPPTVIWL